MIYVKNITNWPDLVGQMMDMTQNYSLLLHKGNFPEKLETIKADADMIKI